jgi:AcrR family transcriptional regulator
MSPRKYDMSKREAAAEETKGRIVAATIELHDRKGIVGTSFDDVARAADVAPGTVRRHFPSRDDLVMACGAHVWQDLRLPDPESLGELFAGARSRRVRLGRVVGALCDSYERGALRLEIAEREAASVGALQGFIAHLGQYREGLLREALQGGGSRTLVQTLTGLTSFATWKALRDAGLSGQAARTAMRDAADCALARA